MVGNGHPRQRQPQTPPPATGASGDSPRSSGLVDDRNVRPRAMTSPQRPRMENLSPARHRGQGAYGYDEGGGPPASHMPSSSSPSDGGRRASGLASSSAGQHPYHHYHEAQYYGQQASSSASSSSSAYQGHPYGNPSPSVTSNPSGPMYRSQAPVTSASGSAHASQPQPQPHGQQRQRRYTLSGSSHEQDGKRYRLIVIQSPSRARMCGFGDKDRRPLSPTLIVKLIIYDARTGRELGATDVDTSAYFLTSDLVHPQELDASPRNLLVHQHPTTVPSAAFQQQQQYHQQQQQGGQAVYAPLREELRARSTSDPYYGGSGIASSSSSASGSQHHWMGASSSSSASSPTSILEAPQHYPQQHSATIMTETYTRNFVGACVASANILKDESDRLGIFFVLQDLSVRTEGVYRIKLTLANLSSPHDGQIRQGVSQALAEAYTEPFTVYTPRRFPGVIEPTALSKKFAAQGVKIPVRVDRKKRRTVDEGEAGAPSGSGLAYGGAGGGGAGAGPSGSGSGLVGADDDGDDDEGDDE